LNLLAVNHNERLLTLFQVAGAWMTFEGMSFISGAYRGSVLSGEYQVFPVYTGRRGLSGRIFVIGCADKTHLYDRVLSGQLHVFSFIGRLIRGIIVNCDLRLQLTIVFCRTLAE
jgi:hypothetical protein